MFLVTGIYRINSTETEKARYLGRMRQPETGYFYCYPGGGKQQKIWQQQAVFSNRRHSHVFTYASEGSSGTEKNETQDFFRYSCYSVSGDQKKQRLWEPGWYGIPIRKKEFPHL